MEECRMSGRRIRAHLLSFGAGCCSALLVTGFMTLPSGASTGAQTPHLTATVAATYAPLTPSRIADTRPGSGYPNAGETLGAGGSINVQVTGVGGVPASGVSAVVVNVTVVGPTSSSYVTLFPEGTTQPVV
jgi:hypothetical protein